MVAIDNPDALDLGALLQGGRTALDLEILDQHYAVAADQYIPIGVLDDAFAFFLANIFRLWPFVAAIGANEIAAVRVGVFKGTLGAGGCGRHGGLVLFAVIKAGMVRRKHLSGESLVLARGQSGRVPVL